MHCAYMYRFFCLIFYLYYRALQNKCMWSFEHISCMVQVFSFIDVLFIVHVMLFSIGIVDQYKSMCSEHSFRHGSSFVLFIMHVILFYVFMHFFNSKVHHPNLSFNELEGPLEPRWPAHHYSRFQVWLMVAFPLVLCGNFCQKPKGACRLTGFLPP